MNPNFEVQMSNECQIQERILKRVQNDILVMPNLFRHLIRGLTFGIIHWEGHHGHPKR